MQLFAERNPADGVEPVEVLDATGIDAPVRESSRRGRWLMLAAALAVSGGLIWAARGDAVRAGELSTTTGLHFEDPFALDWVPLVAPGDGPLGYVRPLPMVTIEPACVGFTRADWPQPQGQPTVAKCLDPAFVEGLADNGVVVLDEIVSGGDTWYFLLFGQEIRSVEVDVSWAADRSALAGERVFIGASSAALLVPTGHRAARVQWQVANGARYQCEFPRGLFASRNCL